MKPIHSKFLAAAASTSLFPPEGPPEFAFLGRSNVGKSSLINSLLGQKLAHVSSTPGRTRSINFIGVYKNPNQQEPEIMLVDLPGYGYAKLSKEISAEWPRFINPYLEKREALKLAIVLIDANIPAQESDRQLIHYLRSVERDFLAVATKSDRIPTTRRRSTLAALEKEHSVEGLLAYSVKTGTGREELWRHIWTRAGR
ncbi:MAG TPA: ribosome biogenesis GTP-binding protein YihA/YsxC [Candidatus Saccharimonadales bacterium]|jgi:GTP-binding protein|nr:ribosome biogenesis GTP-binding protein YihA/YsxC [Candidatus Saccharimonadales bacterium]